MQTTWDLTPLYDSFDAQSYQKDFHALLETVDALRQVLDSHDESLKKIESYLTLQNTVGALAEKLYAYASLRLSVDTEDETAFKQSSLIEDALSDLAPIEAQFQRWLATLTDLQTLIGQSPLLTEHRFYLEELKQQSAYLLSNEEESLLAKMKTTGSSSWSKLQDQLTATLLVPIHLNGKDQKLPLSQIRNLAYDADPAVRKTAYEAELAAYPQIAPVSAYCLNGIKGEVLIISKRRGYASVLDMTLLQSRMDRSILTAMFTAMEESIDTFVSYFQAKAAYLGHTNGLPFYDLFAPIGKSDWRFTYEEAAQYVITQFHSFSPSLGAYAEKAFDKGWIDVYPKEGKRGGAFCSNLHAIGESRILTNFGGSFSDVLTLAHELGHGYHGEMLKNNSYLNSDYPMPIAETASTFCETLVKTAAMKTASADEKRMILETDISDAAQVIIDIMSRFQFEDTVFQKRQQGPLSAEECNAIMLQAQKNTYRNGLDPQYLHPYMWVCKSHYYDGDYNYYNFPYAFGQLLSKGLYAQYQKEGAAFVPKYEALLKATGDHNLLDVAKTAGISLEEPSFWKQSLALIAQDIATLCSLLAS